MSNDNITGIKKVFQESTLRVINGVCQYIPLGFSKTNNVSRRPLTSYIYFVTISEVSTFATHFCSSKILTHFDLILSSDRDSGPLF